MTLRDLIEKANGNIDRPVFFLPSPEAVRYTAVESAVVLGTEEQVSDENEDRVPAGAILLFPC